MKSHILGEEDYPNSAVDGHATWSAELPVARSQYAHDGLESREDELWSVRLEVGRQAYDIPLPRNIASTVTELQQALAELSSEVLGVDMTPSEWMRDNFATMRVEYLDQHGRYSTMRATTSIRSVHASRQLRVSHTPGL